jgi:hypothetical protein
MTTPDLPPQKVALVIDGEVVDVLHINERLAAILLSDPTVVDITSNFAENPNSVNVGFKYDKDTNTFSPTVIKE